MAASDGGRAETTDNGTGLEATGGGSGLKGFLKYSLLWIALLSLSFFFLDLGTPSLNDGEAMYAEIAREMRMGSDWVTPRLNGARHFDKPPLTYWLIGISQKVLGETEFSARMWSALATIATILAAGAIGRTLYGKRAGALAALVYATSLGPFLFGRLVMPDMPLCMWIALAILGYLRGYGGDPRGRGPWPWAMFACLGLCALTKGLLGIGLPVAVIGLHLLLSRRLRTFFSWRFAAGACLTATIAVPWHAAVARANPDFLGYYLIHEHIQRFTGQRYPADEFLPLSLFLALTFVWTFPWLAMVPQAYKRAMRRLLASDWRKGPDLLPLVWTVFIVALFAASRSRLEYYALPAMAGVAVLVGKLWDDLIRAEPGGPSRRASTMALGAMACAMGAAAIMALAILGPGKEMVFRIFALAWPEAGWEGSPEQAVLLDRIRIPAMIAMAGIALFAAGALAAMKKSRPRLACGLLAGMTAPFFVMVHWGFLVVEPYQSSRSIAEILNRCPPVDEVVFQEPHEYMWVGGITYYTKRMVTILKDPKFEGVTARRREPPERFLDAEGLLVLWGSGKSVILIVDRSRRKLVEALSRVWPVEIVGRAGNMTVYGTAMSALASRRESSCAPPMRIPFTFQTVDGGINPSAAANPFLMKPSRQAEHPVESQTRIALDVLRHRDHVDRSDVLERPEQIPGIDLEHVRAERSMEIEHLLLRIFDGQPMDQVDFSSYRDRCARRGILHILHDEAG